MACPTPDEVRCRSFRLSVRLTVDIRFISGEKIALIFATKLHCRHSAIFVYALLWLLGNAEIHVIRFDQSDFVDV